MGNKAPSNESIWDKRPIGEQWRDFIHSTNDAEKIGRAGLMFGIGGIFGLVIGQSVEGGMIGASAGLVVSSFDPIRNIAEMPGRIAHNIQVSKMTAAERSSNETPLVSIFTGKPTEGYFDGSEGFVIKD